MTDNLKRAGIFRKSVYFFLIFVSHLDLLGDWAKRRGRNGRKLESVENIVRNIFIQCLVFNKTIVPLMLVGYELMIADSVLSTSSAI